MNFKNIHIGNLIEKKAAEKEIEISRICKFIGCTEDQVSEMYQIRSLDTELLLRWSKLLEYDFFRLYTQHMILYAPPASDENKSALNRSSSLPVFRKNIYTKEIIDFILELITMGEKTIPEIIQQYRIPRATIYKWISKYHKKS
ncbi:MULTISPECIES: helix-turn-helix domain-containing protein [Chryseobacterium]|uniref:Insertion element IS150 protein InsJ-like helix-turn-helix domain-containing protein n=1 Tax=Chryseobacterium camelliae TaxID=1265445 RepID=A0ABU0TIU3_9FLAO|nr:MULTISPECIES: helix-turn-helix domain-containing protein [Chryseobacterium]MDT3406029.1 hypothetical protein [Pseudacidovorax intermedius]MDQ1096170.1 hypothetical protein [Chryseobacterium camelliae]MDQ1100106.1 hypothetical protein [Chryseobacterium sp. SORGH_AS_1048]MDR6087450.1 hypothetical protein [Chryseobacterium sp. SORGH_AS_0909]MDR6131824.1 hypothetical protein [Chryseobacterium sp. SORGH_AS_1175]